MTDNDQDIQDFADMSAAMTGFRSDFLKPQLDPNGLSQQYFDMATHYTEGKAATVQTLLTAYRAIKTQPAQQIANTLLETSASVPSPQARLAQSIVRMWYTASWYDPTSGDAIQVVSSFAYTMGLAWQVMQSHAMGYSPFNFGYWNVAPGPLSQFGVDDGSGGAQ